MASLIDHLIDILEKENSEYELLLELSMKKTPIIVEGDIAKLNQITDEEQSIVGNVNRFDKERESIMQDIAKVVNKDVQSLKLDQLIVMLASKPEEQGKLSNIHRKLKNTMNQMVRVNNHNKNLIEKSLEMVAYDMNVIKSLKAAPETANYDKSAYNAGENLGTGNGAFDAKQ